MGCKISVVVLTSEESCDLPQEINLPRSLNRDAFGIGPETVGYKMQ